MKVILNDDEVKETDLLGELLNSADKSLVVIKGSGCIKDTVVRTEEKSNIVKEITALDALTIGPLKASEINGVLQSSATKYSQGKDIKDEDTRARINNVKYNIEDTAVAKLMDTLNLFDPSDIEKPIDKIRAAGQLASIVEKISGKNKQNGPEIQLHFHSPREKKIESYEVINV